MTWGKRRALVVGLVILFAFLMGWAIFSPARISSHSVLVLEIGGTIAEQRPQNLLSALGRSSMPVLHDYTDAIDTAASDSRMAGLAVKIGPLLTGWGKLEEIRSHLYYFRRSHKPEICYLGADGIGNREYYLASACDQVWLMPTVPLSIRGLMAEALFLRGTFDKLKIVPDYLHTGEYKTATNMYTEKKFTPAHREQVDSLLHSVYNQYLTEVSEARGLRRDTFEALVQQGPFQAGEAEKNKLVDRLAYWDQLQGYFKERVREWNPVELSRYRARVRNDGPAKIAVIQATGTIVSGESDTTPSGGFLMGGDSVSADIRRAREDSSIKAIVLRVDSGGGSAVASEVIRREVELAKREKPVVVSMSDVAASGGYFISMSANRIVADPNTITASIGVLTGKMNISGLFSLLGLSTDYVATSENATLYWEQQNFTPAQRQFIQRSIWEVYSNFKRGVAQGRSMSVEAVEKVSEGRVWTGAQAKDLGLVDELGGLDRAIGVAKQLAHIPADRPVRLVRLPQEKSFFEQLFEKGLSPSAQSGTLEGMLRRLAGVGEPIQLRMPFELRIR